MRKKEKISLIIMSMILPAALFFLAKEAAIYVSSQATLKPAYCVVIDSGHGGNDPGKVGVTGALEKEINLSIAKKLKQFLEQQGVKVVMTRTSDAGLYEEGASNKKVQDMKNRVALIEETAPDLVVSIHQNSYHEEYVSGAQVFYFKDSLSGQQLAEIIQENLKQVLNPENNRQAKANDSYYLLKKTSCPIVIVECGFLSNAKECAFLETDYYQEKAAWAVHMGILQFLSQQEQPSATQ